MGGRVGPRARRRLLPALGLASAALVGFAALYAAGVLGRGEDRLRIDADDARAVALGARIYGEFCAACHGRELEGEPDWRVRRPDGRLPAPPHDETGHTWHHSDAVLFTLTRDGLEAVVPGYESDMPAFADILTDEEILATLAYIKSTWPAEIRRIQEQRSAAER